MAFDVDLFTAGETPFEILGQNTGGAEPSAVAGAIPNTVRRRPGRPRWRQRYRENVERFGADHQCRARSSSHSSACRGHNPSAPLSRREPTASPSPNPALPHRNRRSAEWYLWWKFWRCHHDAAPGALYARRSLGLAVVPVRRGQGRYRRLRRHHKFCARRADGSARAGRWPRWRPRGHGCAERGAACRSKARRASRRSLGSERWL